MSVDRDQKKAYQIRIQGHLDPEWAEWFGGLEISHLDDGGTLLDGELADQSALHGLLIRIRDLGLPLVSVNQKISTTSARRQGK